MDIDLALQALRDQGKTVEQIQQEIELSIAEDAAKWRATYNAIFPSNLEDALRDAYEHGAQSAPSNPEDQEDE